MEAIAIAGKTNPTSGTKIEGKYSAVIINILNLYFHNIIS